MSPEPNFDALAIVLQAYGYAQDATADPWQFALAVRELEAVGLTFTDIRWLLLKKYALLAKEITTPADEFRSFRPLPFTALARNAFLVLTDDGAAELGDKLASRTSVAAVPSTNGESLLATVPVSRPHWDAGRRELLVGDIVVKRFRVPAPNQETILQVFEEEGWPTSIDDPLPPTSDIDCQHRLRATIKSLNRSQNRPLIRFHGNGGGQVIYWDRIDGGDTAPPHARHRGRNSENG